MQIYLDVETIPGQSAKARDLARQGIKPPAALKKPESIAAWWEHEAEGAATEAWKKQALDLGLQGEVVSIAACNEDGQSWARCREQNQSEAELLQTFFATVEGWLAQEAQKGVGNPNYWPADPAHLVAHNAAVDLHFLWHRTVVHRLAIPEWLPKPTARAGKDFGCTMLAWAGYGGRVSLDSLCTALGIESPKDGGMDGGKVLDAWLAGQYAEIERYNLQDAQAVAQVWQRLLGGRA